MYLRHTVIRKNGKAHTYWRLVRSVRIGKSVRQEIVAQLGELDAQGRIRAQALAKRLGAHEELPGLFDWPLEKEVAQIRLNAVALERVRRFGDVWLGTKLWRMAKLDEFFEKHLPPWQEDIPWWTTAQILTLARLCEPSSELHIAEDWIRKTALADLLEIDETKVNKDRLYRGLDKVLALKLLLEAHLKEQWQGRFEVKYDLLLYDITSTYFEGQAKRNKQAKRGHSRDHRGDYKQVCIGLIVTRSGMPLGFEVFDGNIHDSETVKKIIESIEARYGKADRVWVMDRGMVSQDIFQWMRQGGRRYVLALMKSALKPYEALLKDTDGWKTLREGIVVRWAPPNPDTGEKFLLCRSADRQQKDQAIEALFAQRIEEGLESLKRRRDQAAKDIDLGKVQRQIGRLLQRNQRAAALFDIRCQADPHHPSKVQVHWTRNESEQVWRALTHGVYILAVYGCDASEADLWTMYIQLTQVEDAFRTHKSQLDMRPIYHQKEDRVQAHILICFLAYCLWKMLEQWQRQAGLGNSPRTILEELGHIQSGDIVLPTTTGERIRLRSIVRPEKPQKILLERLGLVLPKRMRIPPAIEQQL